MCFKQLEHQSFIYQSFEQPASGMMTLPDDEKQVFSVGGKQKCCQTSGSVCKAAIGKARKSEEVRMKK